MRSYAQIAPRFWISGSGKRLRGHKNAQIVALYLMSAPATNMIGIFHVALPTLCHETGLSEEDARDGLRKCAEPGIEIAFWDEAEELVWVPALAKHQIGEALSVGRNGKPDHRIAGVRRELAPYKGHRFYDLFMERYGVAYGLITTNEAPSKPLRSPLEAPSKPPPMGYVPDLVPDPDPVPDLDPVPVSADPDPDGSDLRAREGDGCNPPGWAAPLGPDLRAREGDGSGTFPLNDQPPPPPQSAPRASQAPASPRELTLQERATLWQKDRMRAALEAPHPETWPEMRELADALARAFGGPPELPRHAGDGRATAALARWSEGYSNAELCEAIRGAALDDHLQAHPQFQTLSTVLKSPEQVDRFRKLARQGRKTGLARASPRVARDVVTENQERQLRRAAELRAKEEAEKAIKAGFF